MTPPRPLDALNTQLNAKLIYMIARHRRSNKSWQTIAFTIRERYGVAVHPDTVSKWYRDRLHLYPSIIDE